MSRDKEMLPNTSYVRGISCKAHTRMQCIWMQFGGGVKSLYDLVICLNEPAFDTHKLQQLSENARHQKRLAKEHIMRVEDEITDEIFRLLIEKQKIETDIRNTESKIISLTQTIKIKEEDIKRANDDLKSAKLVVNLHNIKRLLLMLTDAVFKTHATAVVVLGGVITIVIAVVSGGIAVPVVATVSYMSISAVSVIAAGATHNFLKDAKKDLQKKRYVLQEHQQDLDNVKKEIAYAKKEVIRQKERLRQIVVNNSNNNDDLKVITKLKVSVGRCHAYIRITLGRVEDLCERKKREQNRANLKIIIKDVIEHISDVSAIKEFSDYIQPIKEMAIKMSSLCNNKKENTLFGNILRYLLH